MNKARELGASPKKGANAGKIHQTVWVTKENLLILMTPTTELNELNKEWVKVSFKYTIETPEEYKELLLFLYKNWVEDLTVRLENGKLVENPKEAVWQDTFIFYDPAAETVLWWYFKINSDANITQKWNTIYVSKAMN